MQAPDFDSREPEPPHYASFVLRCWTGDLGQIRARLIDVHSGVSRPVNDLAELPGLVRHLVEQAVPDEQEP
jgi:hypothetical protein